MKECNKQFFSDKGITSSSANHLANIAKETAEQIKSELNNINFLKTTVSLLGSKDPQLIKDGISNEDLETIQDKLQVVIEANAFIAWVREAIKAKDDEITAVKSMSVESYYSDVLQLGVMDTELMYPKEIKDSDILANWNIKERNEYFSLEAEAAVIGKFIHPEGSYAKARKKLLNNNEKVVEKSDSYVLVYESIPTVDVNKEEEVFFKLQKKHREVNAQLNKLKSRITNEKLALQVEENNKVVEHNSKVRDIRQKYTDLLNEYRTKETDRIAKLKIVIPNELINIYNRLNTK